MDLPFANGRTLGFYHEVAHYTVLAPIGLLLLVALVYNIFVGISTAWVYKNIAWTQKRKKAVLASKQLKADESKLEDTDNGDQDDEPASSKPPGDNLDTSVWEDIFVMNIKLAGYLLGGCVKLKDLEGDYVVLKIQDYVVFIPLAIIFIQISEVVVCAVLLVILMESLLIEVTDECSFSKSIDCYETTNFNMSSLPLDCATNLSAEVICYRLKFDLLSALAIAGGFLKIAPTVLFSTTMFAYLKLYNVINHNISVKYSRIVSIVLAEIILVGGGISALTGTSNKFSSNEFGNSNPLEQMRNISMICGFFVLSCFMWCIYPQSTSATRFQKSNWKKEVTAIQKKKKQEKIAKRKAKMGKGSESILLKPLD